MPKLSIIGAGSVGAQAALFCLQKQLGDVVLIDIDEGIAKGKALDLQQMLPVLNLSGSIVGGSDYALTKNSDIIIITAGSPRKPGMSRDDLLKINTSIIKGIVEQAAKQSPNAIILMMTNPLDAMTYLALKVSGFPRSRVIGQAGILDSARFQSFIAKEVNAHAKDVVAPVLGSHGDEMVALPRYAMVNNHALLSMLSEEKIDKLILRTKNAGAEVTNLMRQSAFFAPAASIAVMAESSIKNKGEVFPCSVYLEGEYGLQDVCVGVPVVLATGGVQKIITLDLSDDEVSSLTAAAQRIAQQQSIVDDELAPIQKEE